MNNSVFGKTMENVRNHRNIKLVTSGKRRKRLVSEPNYLLTLKPKIFLKMFPMMLRDGLIHLTMKKMIKDLFQQVRIKKVPGLFKDELGGKIMRAVVSLRPKPCSYLKDGDGEEKKAKGTKKCVIKQKLAFENFKDCLFNNKTVYRSQKGFRSYYHVMYTEEVNKIALSSNDDKRLQTFDRITIYPYGRNAFRVCESEMTSKYKC